MAISPEPISLSQSAPPPPGEARLTLLNRILTFLAPPLQTALTASTELSPLLTQERERILTVILRAMSVLGLVSLPLFLPGFIQEMLIFLACLALIGLIAWNRRIDYRVRVGLFLAIEYSLGALNFLDFGLTPEGATLLYSFTITAMILVGSWAGLAALGLSVVTVLLVGWLIISGLWVLPQPVELVAPVTVEIIISTGLIFLMQAGLVMAALQVLLNGYRLAWQRERLATYHIQQERDLLEYRVAERTRELSQAYEQASSANQYKTEFMARVTHDLRTPLGVIQGYAEVMQQELLGPLSPQQESALQQMVDNVHYLNNLIQDLLDGSQIEHAQLRIVYAPFQPREMVEQICTPLEALARAKSLQFTTDIDPKLPDVLTGDEKRIKQILSNLISNAIKFTHEGLVKVSFNLPDVDHWAIQVSDTGPGISQEAQRTIFLPFWQVEGKTASLGYGLGLAIVKQLTYLMEGELSVTSAIGQGSSFTVVFPLDPQAVRGTLPKTNFTPLLPNSEDTAGAG